MSGFYGGVQGGRGPCHRTGTKQSGIDVYAKSWETETQLQYSWNNEKNETWVEIVARDLQHGQPLHTIYHGPEKDLFRTVFGISGGPPEGFEHLSAPVKKLKYGYIGKGGSYIGRYLSDEVYSNYDYNEHMEYLVHKPCGSRIREHDPTCDECGGRGIDWAPKLKESDVSSGFEHLGADVTCPKCGAEVWDVAGPDNRMNKCWVCGSRFEPGESEFVSVGEDAEIGFEHLGAPRTCKYVFPEEKKWPIYNAKKAMTALTWSTWPQHKDVRSKVQRTVKKCWPDVFGRFEGRKVVHAPEETYMCNQCEVEDDDDEFEEEDDYNCPACGYGSDGVNLALVAGVGLMLIGILSPILISKV